MKTMKKHIRLGALLIAIMLSANCKTVNIRTVLESDASIVRQISVSGDSSGVDETAYPFPQNGSWLMSKKRDENNNTNYTYLISNNFSNISELNQALDYQADSIKINAIATLKKSFRWFYTYYRYTETFYSFFPFSSLPLQNYLTPEEYQLVLSGVDSSDIDDKIELYIQDNFYSAYSQELERAIDKYPELQLSAADIDSHKQDIIQLISEWPFGPEELLTSILTATDSLLQPQKSLLSIRHDFVDLDSTLSKYMALIEKIITEDYRVEVEMPGQIFDANANNTISKKMAVWEFESDRFHFTDYEMWVESRRLNIIPTILTLLLLFSGFLSLYLSAQNKKRQKLAEQGIEWQDRKRFILKWPFSCILILLGLGLSAWSAWMYLVFNSEPVFFWLDIFNASPGDNALFISFIVIGLLLLIVGIRQLILSIRQKKCQKTIGK